MEAKDFMPRYEAEGIVYAGTAAAPGSNGALIDVLEALGFRQNPRDPEFWIRPLGKWPPDEDLLR
jgi:hypothetical protein